VPDAGLAGMDWESCITMNGNWGYNRADKKFKSVETLIGLLVETASKGGNLLLNVGPTGEGLIPDESVTRLKAIGDWMKVHAESIRGTQATPFEHAPFRATRKNNLVFVFLPAWPADRNLIVPPYNAAPKRARLLGRSGTLAIERSGEGTHVQLPEHPGDAVCSVVVLES